MVFGNAPTFPALLQFSLNTTVIGLISYLRPGGERAEGRRGGRRRGTQPTAPGGRRAWVATSLTSGLRPWLLLSRLEAVYERLLEGRPNEETGRERARRHAHGNQICTHTNTPDIIGKAFRPRKSKPASHKQPFLCDFSRGQGDAEECEWATHQAGVSNQKGSATWRLAEAMRAPTDLQPAHSPALLLFPALSVVVRAADPWRGRSRNNPGSYDG